MSYNFLQYKVTLGSRDNWGVILNNMVTALSAMDNELASLRNNLGSLLAGLQSLFLPILVGKDIAADLLNPSSRLLLSLAAQGLY